MPSKHSAQRVRFFYCCILGFCLFFSSSAPASVDLANDGHAKAIIIQQAEATGAEKHAAAELKLHLDAITGASFQIVSSNGAAENAIIVGPGALASKLFPDTDLNKFGAEEYVIRT